MAQTPEQLAQRIRLGEDSALEIGSADDLFGDELRLTIFAASPAASP